MDDRRVRAVALIAAAALLSCGCGGPQVRLLLELGPGAEAPAALKVVLRDLSADAPDVYGPYPVDEVPPEDFAEVPPGQPFYFDVWGCRALDEGGCDDEAALAARGCTGIEVLERGEARDLPITLLSAAEGGALCPP